jgi:hypothetical protein
MNHPIIYLKRLGRYPNFVRLRVAAVNEDKYGSHHDYVETLIDVAEGKEQIEEHGYMESLSAWSDYVPSSREEFEAARLQAQRLRMHEDSMCYQGGKNE